jgi:hypothetical protein
VCNYYQLVDRKSLSVTVVAHNGTLLRHFVYQSSPSYIIVQWLKMGRAVLMKNCSQASFSGGEKRQEERLSWQPMFKVQGNMAASNVVVDKIASTALIMKCSSLYLCRPIVNCAIDNFNEKDMTPIYDCVYLPGYCALCILHNDSNNGQQYYHCRKSLGDHCSFFKWVD